MRPTTRPYTGRVDTWPPVEDQRGVDVGQIREQLRLPVKERVRVMVEAANVLIDLQERTRTTRAAETG